MKNITFTSTVLICDGTPDSQGDVILKDGVSIAKNPAPVLHEFDDNKWIGGARLFWEGNQLKAECKLTVADTEGEEQKAIHASIISLLYPAIGGHITEKHENGIVANCSIDCVSLNCSPNADKRIRVVGGWKEE